MKALLDLMRIMLREVRRALLYGFALSVAVLVMGVALLGLSGWFITAAAAAGMAGLGILFNVFIPSSMVRFLALGRTFARYGERVLTHDATLRALSTLRRQVLQGLMSRPFRSLERLRANAFLNRVTADIDALDGALLRLFIPAFAGWLVILAATAVIWWLVHPAVALLIGLGYLLLPTLVFLLGQRVAQGHARRTEAALQAARSRLIDLIAGRDDLAVYGQINATAAHVQQAFARHAAGRQKLDRIERHCGAALDLITALITASALAIGGMLVQAGELNAAQAAIAVFAALALGEAVAPVRRALSEIGRMVQAARRVLPLIEANDEPSKHLGTAESGDLILESVSYENGAGKRRILRDLSLTVAPGEMCALTGPSGVGKSTVLLVAAGALAPSRGLVTWAGQRLENLPPQTVVLVPQRSALISGSIAENLRFADPEASDDCLWDALNAVCLANTVQEKGGLSAELGFRGAGLSGGEARRLVLARAILCRPAVLLLDEPTEGLDEATAARVMAGLRAALPDAAILMASHRSVEVAAADHVLTLSNA
ncbi:thiol reductant ABC exporter subunit CydC [Pacificoceanicola onchidii]|uniref:thiol reductant ABC exporter subunit CydC n=1 Tax=Pacificoceanicola onchidii TaxID=2562685 RepID=UPI001F0D136F|nr:thiol reductant ABC exporter subunit CydC [Pacificoceanicola onchidii]